MACRARDRSGRPWLTNRPIVRKASDFRPQTSVAAGKSLRDAFGKRQEWSADFADCADYAFGLGHCLLPIARRAPQGGDQ